MEKSVATESIDGVRYRQLYALTVLSRTSAARLWCGVGVSIDAYPSPLAVRGRSNSTRLISGSRRRRWRIVKVQEGENEEDGGDGEQQPVAATIEEPVETRREHLKGMRLNMSGRER